jgi:DNA (cytosine-5)-methyltransferase 1
MAKPRLLDLFCGAGGAGMGYHQAGFEVIGIDLAEQPRYPFEFHQADALTFPLEGFDVVHASPPCQAHTPMSNRWRGKGTLADTRENLIPPTRARLLSAGVPYVLENVVGARPSMRTSTVLLSGEMFGLAVHRPRLFESNRLLLAPPSMGRGDCRIGVYGDHPDGGRLNTRADGTVQRRAASIAEASEAMGIDWMAWPEIKEAIPPAYTRFIGEQLLTHLKAVA